MNQRSHGPPGFIARRRGAGTEFLRGQWIYLVHVLALILPGEAVPLHPAHQKEAKELAGWKKEELDLMIAEGRRQSDRQHSALEQIRGRAQWLFTVSAPVVTAIAAVWPTVDKSGSGLALVFWVVGLIFASYAVLGAAAIMIVRADFEVIDTAVLSEHEHPVLEKLAADYAAMMSLGENTVATRITVLRQAVVFLVVGGYTTLIVWLSVR